MTRGRRGRPSAVGHHARTALVVIPGPVVRRASPAALGGLGGGGGGIRSTLLGTPSHVVDVRAESWPCLRDMVLSTPAPAVSVRLCEGDALRQR